MEIIDKLLKQYFKIPRKIRFFVYYLVAFCLYMYIFEPSYRIVMDGNTIDPVQGIKDISTVVLEAAQERRVFQTIVILLAEWFVILIGFAFFSLPITIVLFVGRNVIIAIKRDNRRYTAEENIEYYRETLNNIPPAIVSIIDNFKIEPKKDMLAGILKLFLTGHVKFENNTLKVVDKDINHISVSQQVLYEMIKDGKLDNYDSEMWKKVCFNEAIKKDFIVSGKAENDKHIINHTIRGVVILAIIIFGIYGLVVASIDLRNYDILPYAIVAVLLAVGFYFPYLLGYNLYYGLRRSNYRYTEKGEKSKIKLDGLKKFIKDYTSLDEKEKLEVVLWDDYLIYAIIFENNTRIIKDMLKMRGLDTKIDFDEFYFVKDS